MAPRRHDRISLRARSDMTTYLKTRQVGSISAALAIALTATALYLHAASPQAVGTWVSLGNSPDSRIGAAAVALPDGRTLIAGGSIDGVPTDTVVVFNPADASFAAAGHLLAVRLGHTATLLADGRVLIVGGTVNS